MLACGAERRAGARGNRNRVPRDRWDPVAAKILEDLGLGPVEVRRILHDVLGYADRVPDAAFVKDTKWE